MESFQCFPLLDSRAVVQAHGVSLDPAQLCVIGTCAVLAAISAAAIPSAGLVTMVMVMQVTVMMAMVIARSLCMVGSACGHGYGNSNNGDGHHRQGHARDCKAAAQPMPTCT